MFTIPNLISYLATRGRLVPSGQLGPTQRLQTTLRNSGVLLEMVKSIIPPLSYAAHKGQAGRIGVIGGCQEYTGAPYFAAMSALKLGADLAHVFCTQDSSTVIKSYSPELIVHPVLDHPSAVTEVSQWLERLHAIVIGPGLGRNPKILDNVRGILQVIKQRQIPIVIDADGLYLVTESPDVIKNYKLAILTPNIIEFARLYEKTMGQKPKTDEPVINVKQLSQTLGVTIVRKGENDIISNGSQVLVCCGEGSARRCGGQGDLLSGTMGAFTFWAHNAVQDDVNNDSLAVYGPTICAAYAACLLTRECNRLAFSKYRRSTTTSDMVASIQEAFEYLYM